MYKQTIKKGERLVIGDVTIVCVMHGRRILSLSIDAPEHTDIVHERAPPQNSGGGTPTKQTPK